MNISDSFNMAARTLVANKLRSGLTMLGIVIGNASVIMTIGIGEGTQKLAVDQLSYVGSNTIFVVPGSPKSQDILIQFTIEAVILSTIGGIIGIAIGVGSFIPIGRFTPLQPAASLSAILLAVSVSSSIGLFFGIVPARQAAKLDPIAALRTG